MAVPGVEYEIVQFRATSLAYLLFNRRRSQAHGVSVTFARSKSDTGEIDRKKPIRLYNLFYFFLFFHTFLSPLLSGHRLPYA